MSNSLYSKESILHLLRLEDKSIKKSLGQNYLYDHNVIKKIASFVEEKRLSPDEGVLEIGCGLGHLTRELLLREIPVLGVEIESKSVRLLERMFHEEISRGLLKMIHQDILDFSFPPTNCPFSLPLIVGNLPYNITSPILFHCFKSMGRSVRGLAFMMQKEVAQRIASPPGKKLYGRLSVMSRYFCEEVKIVLNISPWSFFPAPKVDSALVYFKLKQGLDDDVDISLLEKVVKYAFGMRRKKVATSLRESHQGALDPEALWEALRLFEKRDLRAEALAIEDYLLLYRLYVSFCKTA